MELLDRYLQAVKRFLPKAQQEDIINELSANLLSQIEDREAELGRPLSAAEQTALLNQHGDPVVVAGRYLTEQPHVAFGRQLIGPAFFPFYTRVLLFNLGITFLVCLVVAAVRLALGVQTTVWDTIYAVVFQFALQFVIVTAIFTAAEGNAIRLPSVWQQETVRPVPGANVSNSLKPRLEAFAEFVALAVFTLWLFSLGTSPIMSFGADDLRLAPIWGQIFPLVILLGVYGMAQAAVSLWRPAWIQFRRVARVVNDVFWLGLMIVVLRANEWVVAADSGKGGSADLTSFNQWFFYILVVIAVASAAILLNDVYRLLRGNKNFAQPSTVS